MRNGANINKQITKHLHILVAPLDWGLGHATRCIPIIKLLIDQNCEVTLAASGKQAVLLRQEFPNLELLPLSGYQLTYGQTGRQTAWKILRQVPKILISVKREKRWLAGILAKKKIDIVLSDCRFGLSNPGAFCVFLTHQLTIKSPFGRWTERLLQQWNYRFIHRFNECWVPDFEAASNLAGQLSHPATLPGIPVKYIGGLSRFNAPVQHNNTVSYDVLIILSGPEPQRTIFENILLRELASYNGKAALVRGLPGQTEIISLPDVDVFNHLPALELGALMADSKMVVSRSGYTTVMDLVRLHKKSILVPTPGQTEQEYLGHYLMQNKLCLCLEQTGFSLHDALRQAAGFAYAGMDVYNMELYKEIVTAIIDKLHSAEHLYLPA